MSDTFWDTIAISPIDGSVSAPGYEGATYAESEWDLVVLGGQRIPGICDVEVDPKRRCQNKKQNGSDGATPTFRGLDPAIVRIGVTLWTPKQANAWASLLPIIFPAANKGTSKLNALDISHPITAMHGIRSVIVTGVKSLRGTGVKRTELECVQFVLPGKGAVETPDGSNVATTPNLTQKSTKNVPVPPSRDGKTFMPPMKPPVR